LKERAGLEPQARHSSAPCSSSSLCSALKAGGGGGRASPSAGDPRLSSVGPPAPWEDECWCCSCHGPRKLVKKLVRRVRVPSAAVLCCLLLVLLHRPPAASLGCVRSRQSRKLRRKEGTCPKCTWQMTP